MCRRARNGLVAVIVGLVLLLIATPRLMPRAKAADMRYRLFLPGIIVQPALAWSAAESDVYTIINQKRQANGCPPVQPSDELAKAAQDHSRDMADNNYFSHTGSDGSSFVDRARRAGYKNQPSGEIIAAGYGGAAATVDGWMNSAGHRGIILNCANVDLGVGMRENPNSQYRYYWTAVFGQR